MLRKFLIPAAIGFSAYFLYEKYLAGQNKEMLYEKVCKKLCRKRREDELAGENQSPTTKNSALEQIAKSESRSKEIDAVSGIKGELEEPSSIIEQNKMAQNMFDFNKK